GGSGAREGGCVRGAGEGLVGGPGRARLRPFCILWAGVLGTALLAACTPADPPETATGGALGNYVVPPGIHKIKHVIIIMQENRSFDSYFGTYPGAAGIPGDAAVPPVLGAHT